MTKRKKTTPTFGEQIAQQILENYALKDAQDIQDALKQVFGPIFEAVLKGEMQNHLGYEKNGHSEDSTNARNGYSQKTLKTSLGEVPIRVPRDRQGQFEPQIVKKHQRDVSSIEGKVLAMYATTEPEASFGLPLSIYSDGFSTSTSPSVRISKTPISFVEPKRFFTPRRIR